MNLASRLQGCSEGDDIVLSAALTLDPTVKQLLCGLPLTAETASLKGFVTAIPFFRIRARALAVSAS